MWQTSRLNDGIGIPVAHGISICTLFQVTLHDTVVLGVSAFWDIVVRDVWNRTEMAVEFVFRLFHLCLQFVRQFFQLGDFGFGFLGLFTLSLLHQLPDLSGVFLAFSQCGIQTSLRFTTHLIKGNGAFHCLACTLKVLLLQSGDNSLGLFSNEF